MHSVNSLTAGYIGLDFLEDVGDLMLATQADLPGNQLDYWAFAHEMAIGDEVLVIAHHFPLGLATITGEYNYIRATVPELGVWFRHFRAVKNVRYFADLVTNARSWDQIRMTDTISPLRDLGSQSYQLIERWK